MVGDVMWWYLWRTPRSLAVCAMFSLVKRAVAIPSTDSAGTEACHDTEVSHAQKVLLLTSVLPDGFGDVIFGECAARELALSPVDITWVRIYSSAAASETGEGLVSNTSSVVATSHVFPTPAAFAAELRKGMFDHIWGDAVRIFLAPWIFGIYEHDSPLLDLALRKQRVFWALSEYGRGMGHIHEYTNNLGKRIPTGWVSHETALPSQSEGAGVWSNGGIFKTILRANHTGTDWRANLSARLGLTLGVGTTSDRPPRLWWAYGRKDSAATHVFRLLATPQRDTSGSDAARRWPEVAKVVPMAKDGNLARGVMQTKGELLANQAQAVLHDPSYKANVDVAVASEVQAHVAGQLSELLIHILTRDIPVDEQTTAEIVVAPSAAISTWAGHSAVLVTHLELLDPSGSKQSISLGRPVFIVEWPIPRPEMRTFLEQCEDAVIATGDQSMAEAVLLGKVPMIRPDAKVEQWELALAAMAEKRVNSVPDLGVVLRDLLASSELHDALAAQSDEHSKAVAARINAKLGTLRSPDQETLARAGMFG